MVLKPTSFISSKPETSESQDAGFVTSSKPETIQPRCAGNRVEQARNDPPGCQPPLQVASSKPETHCHVASEVPRASPKQRARRQPEGWH
jgi:hypothetical protein